MTKLMYDEHGKLIIPLFEELVETQSSKKDFYDYDKALVKKTIMASNNSQLYGNHDVRVAASESFEDWPSDGSGGRLEPECYTTRAWMEGAPVTWEEIKVIDSFADATRAGQRESFFNTK